MHAAGKDGQQDVSGAVMPLKDLFRMTYAQGLQLRANKPEHDVSLASGCRYVFVEYGPMILASMQRHDGSVAYE